MKNVPRHGYLMRVKLRDEMRVEEGEKGGETE